MKRLIIIIAAIFIICGVTKAVYTQTRVWFGDYEVDGIIRSLTQFEIATTTASATSTPAADHTSIWAPEDGNLYWENEGGTIYTLNIGSLADLGIGGFTQGSVLFIGAAAVVEDNPNLFWDDSSNRLGIGTSTPAALLDVEGDIIADSILADANASGVLTLGGTGGSNNENLTLNFESDINRVVFDSTTTASFKFNKALFLPDAITLFIGNSGDVAIRYNSDQTNDNLQIGITTGSPSATGHFSLMHLSDLQTANREPLTIETDPVFRIYSSDESEALDYGEFFHDQTDFNITWGNGDLNFSTTTTHLTIEDSGRVGIGTTDPSAQLHTTKGRVQNTDRLTSNTTLNADHHNLLCDTDGGGFTVTLPAGVDGQYYRIANVGSSANTLTLTPDGSELLGGVNLSDSLFNGDVLLIVYETTEGWY